jgi:hypothetical protein
MYSMRWYYLFFNLRLYKFYHPLRHFFIKFLKKKNKCKVFCIGYGKTGNTSLCKALNILGYRSVQWLFGALGEEPKEGWIQYIKKCNYDAFVDAPFGSDDFYIKLNESFPDSKFILTIRDKSSFAKSYLNYFKGSPWEVKNNEELLTIVKKYDERNRQIIQYFKNDSSKLLVMNIIDGDGWIKLCDFLDKPIPKKQFPYKNRGRYNKLRISNI